VVGGARFESTEIDIVNFPEQDAQWFPDGATGPVKLLPGEADVAFRQNDILPALGVSWQATDEVRFRLAYSRTVARQTFKELTPILQQEFLGGPIFIGNPELGMSEVDNYDFRADYEPYQGGLVSASLFKKDIDDPIENVQKSISFTFTTAENYPKGEIEGLELEVRHDLGRTWRALDGLLLGGNATFIDGTVQLPEDEVLAFAAPNIQAPRTERDMTNAPEYLYNLYAIYDVAATGTSLALFYTVKGDTLVAGAGEDKSNFIPDIYELERDTLNFSLTQRLGKYVTLKLQAKNLTDSAVQEVYRSEFINGDTVNTSYREGIDFSVSLGARFVF
jgi:TonB-dependent receptor